MKDMQPVEKPVWQAPQIIAAGQLMGIVNWNNKGSKGSKKDKDY